MRLKIECVPNVPRLSFRTPNALVKKKIDYFELFCPIRYKFSPIVSLYLNQQWEIRKINRFETCTFDRRCPNMVKKVRTNQFSVMKGFTRFQVAESCQNWSFSARGWSSAINYLHFSLAFRLFYYKMCNKNAMCSVISTSTNQYIFHTFFFHILLTFCYVRINRCS